LQVHAKINISPVKTLSHILLLLESKHVLVEKLLQLLIDIVDADLLKSVVIKDLKSCNIKNTDVGDLLHGGVAQGLITFIYHDPEGSFIDGTSNSSYGVSCVLTAGALLDPLCTHLQFGLTEIGDHPLAVNTEKLGHLLRVGVILDFSLFVFAHGNEILGHVTHVHHHCCVLEHVVFLLIGESKDVEGFVGEHHVLFVVD